MSTSQLHVVERADCDLRGDVHDDVAMQASRHDLLPFLRVHLERMPHRDGSLGRKVDATVLHEQCAMEGGVVVCASLGEKKKV